MSTETAQPETIWPELQRVAVLDQVRRLAHSTYVIPALLCLVWVSTPYPQDFAGLYASCVYSRLPASFGRGSVGASTVQ